MPILTDPRSRVDSGRKDPLTGKLASVMLTKVLFTSFQGERGS
jgi:hypothetical protein